MSTLAPVDDARGTHGMVASVDGLATAAGLEMLRRGGSAADAVIAANAVLAVTLPNQCGLGGDLFALVSPAGRGVESLMAVGAAGSGADADRLRSAGHRAIPAADPAAITIPGCIDGWLALHERHGRIPLSEVLAPAIGYAADGFPVSPFAAQAIGKRAASSADAAAMTDGGVIRGGQIVRRPGVARVLADLVSGGHDAVFGGEFGEGIVAASAGLIRASDLAVPAAEWRDPVGLDAFGHRIWSPAPPSQGYLTLSAAWIAESVGLDASPDDPAWAHLLIEAMRQAAFDRPAVLWDGADAATLLAPERLAPRAAAISPDRTAVLSDEYRRAGTTYLCAVDSDGMAVSLMQSNCMSFGSGIVAGTTGVWLQNRGIGFSLEPGHPAELAPGRRPAHTLAPAMITDTSGGFVAALGSRGGDSQPQIVLQLAARLLAAGQSPAEALAAGRFILRGAEDTTSFDTWGSQGRVTVDIEGQAADAWQQGLVDRGHAVTVTEPFAHPFGHAQVIMRSGDVLLGAADPRATSGAALGY